MDYVAVPPPFLLPPGEHEPAWLAPLYDAICSEDAPAMAYWAEAAVAASPATTTTDEPAWAPGLRASMANDNITGMLGAMRAAVVEYNAAMGVALAADAAGGEGEEVGEGGEEEEEEEEEEGPVVALATGKVVVPGYRWVCYVAGCGEHTKRKDEMSRHWGKGENRSRKKGQSHLEVGLQDPHPEKRFLVLAEVLETEEGVEVAKEAQSAEEFLQGWEARG